MSPFQVTAAFLWPMQFSKRSFPSARRCVCIVAIAPDSLERVNDGRIAFQSSPRTVETILRGTTIDIYRTVSLFDFVYVAKVAKLCNYGYMSMGTS